MSCVGPAGPEDENERNFENFLFVTQFEIRLALKELLGEQVSQEAMRPICDILRTKLTELKEYNDEQDTDAEDAARWRKFCDHAYYGEALRALVYAPCGDREDVIATLNGWIDELVVKK